MAGPCDALGHGLQVNFDWSRVGQCYRCGRRLAQVVVDNGERVWVETARVAQVEVRPALDVHPGSRLHELEPGAVPTEGV